MKKVDILLIYPTLGSMDDIVKDIPLSLIYAAADSVQNGYTVKIFDCRLYPHTWKEKIDHIMKDGCRLVGLSVMTGNPITTSLEISRFIKKNYGVPIVWGGAHPTILPEQTLENNFIDYVIRDWGSKSLYQLISHIKNNSLDVREITGLGYKEKGQIILNESTTKFELIDYKNLPYHLVDIDSNNYNRFGNQLFFPIFTSIGCPYQCSFCMSPAVYNKIGGKKWIPFPVASVLDHIEYLLSKYKFERIQIFDDDSFIDLDRMRQLLTGYIDRGYQKRLRIDFRGARVNEIDKMDDNFLQLLVKSNVEYLMIGAESGSNDVLRKMNKGITAEQTIRVNKKLSEYQSLKPHFNIMCGIPGEQYEDLVKTKNLMMILAKDNPSCILGRAADWKPLPGSRMTEIAVMEYGLVLPKSLEEWSNIDSLDAKKIRHPWYTTQTNNYIKLLQLAGLFIDQKIEILLRETRSQLIRALLMIAKLYRPILRLRLKYNLYYLLFEYPIKNAAIRLLGLIMRAHTQHEK